MAHNTHRNLHLGLVIEKKRGQIYALKQRIKALNYELMLLKKEQERADSGAIMNVVREESKIRVGEIEAVLRGQEKPLRAREILDALGKAPTSVNRVAVMTQLHLHTGSKFRRYTGEAYALRDSPVH